MDFIDDKEKMKDFFAMSKDSFLSSYSYLSEEEYDATVNKLINSAVFVVFKSGEILIVK